MELQITKQGTEFSLTTFKNAWERSFSNIVPLILAWLISLGGPVLLLAITIPSSLMIDHMLGFHQAGFASLLGLIIPGILIGWFWAGWIYISLKVSRGEPTSAKDVFRPLSQVLPALGVLLITTIFIGIGTSMFVVPGAFLFLKFQLAPYYIIDKGYGAIDSLKKSWVDTDPIFIRLAMLDLIFFALQAVTGFTIIGPFLCHIALTVATAIVYTSWLTDNGSPTQVTGLPD